MSVLRLRVRGPAGPQTVTSGDSLAQLREVLFGALQIPAEEQEIRAGHPPKLVSGEGESSLTALGIRSGETLIVSQRASSAAATASTSAAPAVQPAAGSSSASNADPGPARNARPAPPAKASASSRYIEVDGGFVTLRIVPDDNQCLFHSTGMLLAPGVADAASSMRQAVAKAIRASPDDFNEIVLGKPVEAYISQILSPNSWGGAIELAALSKAFSVEIASVDVQSGRIDRYGEGQYGNVIIVVYSGIHYDAVTLSHAIPGDKAVWPHDLGFDVLSFSSDAADVPLIATVELSRRLKAEHYYTDTATFTLRCEVCKTGLVGEKEAREHAKKTGHASFGEYS